MKGERERTKENFHMKNTLSLNGNPLDPSVTKWFTYRIRISNGVSFNFTETCFLAHFINTLNSLQRIHHDLSCTLDPQNLLQTWWCSKCPFFWSSSWAKDMFHLEHWIHFHKTLLFSNLTFFYFIKRDFNFTPSAIGFKVIYHLLPPPLYLKSFLV